MKSYSSLQTSIAAQAWQSDNTDFVTVVPDLIALCHSDLNDQLRTREMETEATLSLSNGEATLPEDYVEFRSVIAGRHPLSLITPDQATAHTGAGTPLYFTIIGNTLRVYPSSDGDVTLIYFQRIPELSDTNPTNWLLLRKPAVYLYGSLLKAEAFMKDDARMVTWAALYEKAMSDFNNSDTMSKYARSTVRVRGATP